MALVRGGVLGINVEPPPAQEGVLRVTGHASLIQGDEWLGFRNKVSFRGRIRITVELPDEAAMSSADVVSGELADNGSDGLPRFTGRIAGSGD